MNKAWPDLQLKNTQGVDSRLRRDSSISRTTQSTKRAKALSKIKEEALIKKTNKQPVNGV